VRFGEIVVAQDAGGDRLEALNLVLDDVRCDTARAMGLKDRGVLAPGYLADLNLIAEGELGLLPPQMVHDLPAGGRRLLQAPSGYRATIKRGVVTYRNGVATGALPGRLLRRGEAAQA
jgi:N-acyl-D-aspartate/D-glutamate deacylase